MENKKMVRTTHMDLSVDTREALVTSIDNFRFVNINDFRYIEVEFYNDETYDLLDEIVLDDEISNQRELEIIALNWIFNNVEIVEDISSQSGIYQI